MTSIYLFAIPSAINLFKAKHFIPAVRAGDARSFRLNYTMTISVKAQVRVFCDLVCHLTTLRIIVKRLLFLKLHF